MYGKNLNDFPTRPDSFLSALSHLSNADINAGFELAFRRLKEFPVPQQIIELSVEAARDSRQNLDGETLTQLRLAERNKDERFENTTLEERKREFDEMLKKVAKEKGM